MEPLPEHRLKIQGRDDAPVAPTPPEYADAVRSWLTALVGAEHLALLVGSGLGIAISDATGTTGFGMDKVQFDAPDARLVDEHAENSVKEMQRGDANIEDQLRSALQLLAGLQIVEPGEARTAAWERSLNETLVAFARRGLEAERAIRDAIANDDAKGYQAARLLVSFLLAFASRPPSRERLNVFTTNYDRLIEYGCDLGGLRVLDRFVGSVEPIFRASRLELDLHYNPPGIRGEPRYVEGVLRLCKLHGSLDWRFEEGVLRRVPLSFGGSDPEIDRDALRRLMIYPSAAKDVETALYPYAELFRDLSAALCRPNSVVIAYGYGFGDDHINRVLRDMLTLHSTHLLVIAYSDPGDRIASFLSRVAPEQYSLLFGPHFGDLGVLVDSYLPQPGPEQVMLRQARRDRALSRDSERQSPEDGEAPDETAQEDVGEGDPAE
jgi:SIR2-like domain